MWLIQIAYQRELNKLCNLGLQLFTQSVDYFLITVSYHAFYVSLGSGWGPQIVQIFVSVIQYQGKA